MDLPKYASSYKKTTLQHEAVIRVTYDSVCSLHIRRQAGIQTQRQLHVHNNVIVGEVGQILSYSTLNSIFYLLR